MTINQLLKYYKTQSAACAALHVSRACFTYWGKIGYIPYVRQCKYEKLTDGKLKASHKEINVAIRKRFGSD